MIKRLEQIVYKNKDRTAYKINDEKITYAELWEKANELATSLKKQGKEPIIIYGHKSIEMIISILACLIAKRPYVPADVYTPIERLERIVELTKASLIIKNEKLFYSKIECLTIDEINKQFEQCEFKDTQHNEIAYIIFTSGSTGKPKGVPISYKNLNNFIDWVSSLKPLDSYEKINVLNQASFSFDLSVADLYYSLFNGHTLIALEKKAQEEYNSIFKIIKDNKINFIVMTPTFIKLLLLNDEFNLKNFSALKCMYFCGEQLEVSTVKKIKQRFPDIEVINAYGPTEATSAVSAINITVDMLEYEYLPVGIIEKAAVDIQIIEDEIVLKGNSVFSGYLDGSIGGYFNENGIDCYKTGDIGIVENGLLYCRGRKDNQIKYKGYRIELGDIENNLLKIYGVREVVVVAKYKDNANIVKTIKAFITLEKNIELDVIRNQLKKYLPDYMIPKTIIVLDKIPINKNGKYDRKKLQEL